MVDSILIQDGEEHLDQVLIQDGHAQQIWRGIAKVDLPPLHPDLVVQIVERPEGVVQENDLWDGTSFSSPIELPEPVVVLTSTIITRMTDAEVDIFSDMKNGDGVGTNLPPGQQKRFMLHFDAAVSVTEGDDLALSFVVIFGATRAAELLAPA